MPLTPTQRSTREWPLLVLAIALVCAVCIPLWQWTLAGQAPEEGEPVARWTNERIARLLLGPEQIICYAAFVWASFILLSRYLEVRRQRQAFDLHLLPAEEYILPGDARAHQRRIDEQVGRRGPFILANMLRLALGKYAVSRSGNEVSETVRTQADVDISRLVSSLAMVNYLAWAIPAIGFLGTVRGLAGSLTLGGETKKAVAVFIKEATGHLNVAFDCTLVALGLSLLVMLFLHAVQREEEGLVIDCQQYALEHLVNRLYDVDAEAANHTATAASIDLPAQASVPAPVPVPSPAATRRRVS